MLRERCIGNGKDKNCNDALGTLFEYFIYRHWLNLVNLLNEYIIYVSDCEFSVMNQVEFCY